jgi:hypothetical protein
VDILNKELKNELLDTLQHVTEDASIRHHDSQSGETFEECALCGEWDSHTAVCIIPSLITWLGVQSELDEVAKDNA